MSARVYLVGAQPPPVHGVAMINAALRARIEARAPAAAVIDVAARSLDAGWRARLGRLPRIARGAWRILKGGRAGDALYLSLSGGWGQLYELAFVLAARARRMRCYLHHHSYAYLDRGSRLARALFCAAGREAVHVALSEGMAERLRARYAQACRRKVVPNAGLLELQAEAAPPLSRRRLRTVGFLGNVCAEKGVFDFLDVAEALRESGIAFVLAGPFVDAATESAVRARLSRLSHAWYAGPQYGERKAAFFRRLDALLFPTRYPNEAAPLTLLEAMMHGVPVIAYGRGSIGEMVGDAGLVIPPEANFVRLSLLQIEEWHRFPEVLASKSVRAYRRFVELRQRALEEVDALLRELCGG